MPMRAFSFARYARKAAENLPWPIEIKKFKKISTQGLTVLKISVILHVEQRKGYRKGTGSWF